jgi:PAS domain S-box-containing protein
VHSTPTIVIVDDAAEVRALVRARLRLSCRIEVVGEGADGAAAVALAAEHRPDLMLLDVSMPGIDGLEALPRVLEASPETRVVMYSGFTEEMLARRSQDLGAVAFFEKSTSLETLADDLLALLTTPPRVPAPDEGRGPASRAGVDPVLQEHLERFQEVFKDAAIGMATMTLTGRLVRPNRKLARVLGRSTADLVGTPYVDLVSDDPQRLTDAVARIVRAESDAVRLEHEVTGQAPRRRVQATLSAVQDAGGRPLYLFLQVQDVTRQRGAEDALRRTESRFGLLVDAVQDYAIFMLHPDGHIASWNTGAQRSKGYRAEEIIGQHFRVFYPPDKQAERHPEHELELALRDGSYEEEGWRVRKDGTQFWANVTITAVRDQDDRHIGFAKVTRDTTERRLADEALRQSEQRFRLLVEAVQDYAIFMLDSDGYIASWNAGAQRTKGYTAEEIIGQHFRIFYPQDKKDEGHPEHELELALRDGSYEEEGWRVRKDGTQFWANVTITAVRDHEGRHVGFAKVTRDTSERRHMLKEQERSAQALAAANVQLRAANERLGMVAEEQASFLAVTAHELRAPVGVLAMSAETLVRHWKDLTDEERVEFFAAMTDSSGQLRRLLADLLTASRLQASALDLDLQVLSADEALSSAVTLARRSHPTAEIHVDAASGLFVTADAGRLSQAIGNLVSNALKHGVPPVHVRVDARTDTVEIAVLDAGPGVPTQMQERLFDRFATGSAGGTGLGLFIVRELCRAQGGDAFHRPTDGAFVISLPRASDARSDPDGTRLP